MKIKKAVLKALSIGALVGIAGASCQKAALDQPINTALEKAHLKKKTPPPSGFDCPACGMG